VGGRQGDVGVAKAVVGVGGGETGGVADFTFLFCYAGGSPDLWRVAA
jgi:hypothetical protein